jgi:hypothetical protein
LSGASRNLFVQLGESTIQSGIDAITAGGAVGGSVEVSSGGSTEDVICVRQNYTLVGAICPPLTQTTQITGNLTIGSSGFLSTRVRVSHMKFVGNLIFDSSANQQLRSYFYNCDWNGTITFPSSLATGTNGSVIYFDSCSFTRIAGFEIPNQSLYTIFFNRCSFVGQAIFNNQVVGNTTKTIFTDCSYLPTLSSLGNCILNGLNTTLTSTQGNFGSIVLGGTATSLLKSNGSSLSGVGVVKGDATVLSGTVNQVVLGNGTLTVSNANSIMKGDATTLSGSGFVKGNATLDTNIYTTMVSSTFTATFGTVSNAVFKYTYVFDGTTKVVTLGIPHIRSTITGGPFFLFSSTTNALPAIIRPVSECVLTIRLVSNNAFEFGSIVLSSVGLISFLKLTQWATNANQNGSGCSSPGDYIYVTYVV